MKQNTKEKLIESARYLGKGIVGVTLGFSLLAGMLAGGIRCAERNILSLKLIPDVVEERKYLANRGRIGYTGEFRIYYVDRKPYGNLDYIERHNIYRGNNQDIQLSIFKPNEEDKVKFNEWKK